MVWRVVMFIGLACLLGSIDIPSAQVATETAPDTTMPEMSPLLRLHQLILEINDRLRQLELSQEPQSGRAKPPLRQAPPGKSPPRRSLPPRSEAPVFTDQEVLAIPTQEAPINPPESDVGQQIRTWEQIDAQAAQRQLGSGD